MDETGRTSVTPLELAGRERVAALLTAARNGDAAARAEVLAAALPVIQVVTQAADLGDWTVLQVVSSDLAREIERLEDVDALLNWLIGAVARAAEASGEPSAKHRVRPEHGPGSRLSTREMRLLGALTANHNYHVIAEELRMPVGSIGPQRARVLGKLRRLMETAPPAESRANLEAALRSHSPAPTSREPRRGLLRFLGLTAPEPPLRRHPDDRTIAAVRDVTGAGRDVLRELDVVLTMTHEGEGPA